MSGVSKGITIVEYTLHAILWVPWKAKFTRLPTGDNYLFSFPSFPSSQLIKTLITHSTRIKFKPEEQKCTYAEVTPGKECVELGCSWCQLYQVVVGKNSLVIITAGFITFISCHFYIGLNKLCCGTLETKADMECSKQMSAERKHMQVMAKVCRDPT